MFFAFLLCLCFSENDLVNITEFTQESYETFCNSLDKNHLLISLRTNTNDRSDDVFKLFNEACQNLTEILDANITFGLIFDDSPDVEKCVLVYLSGASDKNVSLCFGQNVTVNTQNILAKSLSLAKERHRQGKPQKNPKVRDLKKKLRKIKKQIGSEKNNEEKLNQLSQEYDQIAEQLISLSPTEKKHIKILKLNAKKGYKTQKEEVKRLKKSKNQKEENSKEEKPTEENLNEENVKVEEEKVDKTQKDLAQKEEKNSDKSFIKALKIASKKLKVKSDVEKPIDSTLEENENPEKPQDL